MLGCRGRSAPPQLRPDADNGTDHQDVFETFARIVARLALEERVNNEPRVVSFRRHKGAR